MTSCMGRLLICLLGLYAVDCSPLMVDLPIEVTDEKFDWRNKGVIGPVNDQGMLGDSIAFVIAEGVESLLAIQSSKPLVTLSREEVAQCCDDDDHQPKYPGYDCVIHLGGLCTSSAYVNTGTCNNGSCPAVGKVTKSGYIQEKNEQEMVRVIHETPLSVFIDASHPSFQTYISGIYNEPNCNPDLVDHVVQVVGYGTAGGIDYWIIKNSWGAEWGEQGYMRMIRGKNMCGIASRAFYPINQK